MNLVIDVGNTRFKYAFFDHQGIKSTGFEEEEMFCEILKQKGEGESVDVFLSGSGKIDELFRKRLRSYADYWLEAVLYVKLPIEIGYETPETLGFDRIAICVGARTLFPGQDLLVIDSGTALTYNYVSESGVFLGGNISPGQEIRFRSLHLFTEKLPYIEADAVYGQCGKNTKDAILNGVMNGIFFEVKGYMQDFYRRNKNAQVVLTGGNCLYLSKKLDEPFYVDKYLGFIGLNEILEYNKKMD